jgi:hypothetical protein
MMRISKLLLLVLLGATAAAQAGFFSGTGDSIVVVRVGTASTSDTAAAVYLDEYDITGAAPSLMSTVAISSTGSDALTMSGNRQHARQLHLSADGQYLTLAGYRLDTGTAGANTSTAARVVGLIDKNGSVNTSTAINSYSGAIVRNASTVDGTQFWVAGDSAGLNGGVQYVSSVGATTSTAVYRNGGTQNENMRDVQIVDNQLFSCSGSSSVASNGLVKGVYQMGSGLSTGGAISYSQVISQASNSPNSFVMMDLSTDIAGIDTLYATATGAMWKWSKLANGSWVNNGSVVNGVDALEFEAVTAVGSKIFGANDHGIFSWTDTGYNQSISGSLSSYYLTADSGMQFGGIQGIPEPVTIWLLGMGGVLFIRRK